MTFKSVLFATTIFALSVSAQSLGIVNLSNSAISPSAVVGDSLQVTISGAAANSLVTLTYTQDGNPGTWNAGYTDGTGYFQYSDTVASAKIGVWYEVWSVGGTDVGTPRSLEVFDKPSSLSVQSVAASSPDACGSSYRTLSTKSYGPSASIQYQIKGATGSSETVPDTGLGIMMEPQESIGGGTVGDIGCDSGGCPTGFLWQPPSAKYATSSGTFYDIPVATCDSVAFSFTDSGQAISIKIGNMNFPVRTQYFTVSSSSPGHGSLTSSSSDISYTQ